MRWERNAVTKPGNSCGKRFTSPSKRRRTAQAFQPDAAASPRPVRTGITSGGGRAGTGDSADLVRVRVAAQEEGRRSRLRREKPRREPQEVPRPASEALSPWR